MINTCELRIRNIILLQNIYFAQYGEEFSVSEHNLKIAWRTVKAFYRQ